MRFLLDTHALMWLLSDDPRLAPATRTLLNDRRNKVLVSVVSLWEIAVKLRVGKLPAETAEIQDVVADGDFTVLPVTLAHLHTLRDLPFFPDHRDPFDHLLIAQAIQENAQLVTQDRHARSYPVNVVPCG